MIQHKDTKMWFKRGCRYDQCWTDRQNCASIWASMRGPSGALGSHQKEKHSMEIVEFELKELGRN